MRHAFGYRPFPENASQAEIIAHKHDEPDVGDWVFRRNIFEGLPHRFAIPVAFRYSAIHDSKVLLRVENYPSKLSSAH